MVATQPGSMYYLQKLMHNICSAVNHATRFLLCMYLMRGMAQKILTRQSHIQVIRSPTYLIGYAEFICFWTISKCSTYKIHTDRLAMGNGCTRPIRLLQNFFPHSRTCGVQSRDLLFMKIVNTYNAREVFTTTELKDDIIAQYAEVIEDDGCPNVCQITPVRLSLWHLSFGQPLHMAMRMTSRDCPYPNWAWMCQKHNCATSKTWDAASDKPRDPESYTVRPTTQQGARIYTQRMANLSHQTSAALPS